MIATKELKKQYNSIKDDNCDDTFGKFLYNNAYRFILNTIPSQKDCNSFAKDFINVLASIDINLPTDKERKERYENIVKDSVFVALKRLNTYKDQFLNAIEEIEREDTEKKKERKNG